MAHKSVTFAVVGRNEAATLEVALGQALDAATSEDEVWFVNSGSTDDSASIAQAMGVTVVPAPVGKGRAIAKALEELRTAYICLLDADIFGSDRSIAAALRSAAIESRAAMVVGEFRPAREATFPRTHTDGIYYPLMRAFFPELADRFGRQPMSGFRALARDAPWGELPPHYGVETHLNLALGLAGSTVSVANIGEYRGRFTYKPEMAYDIASVILDRAEAEGRLSASRRSQWNRWVDDVVAVIAEFRGEPDQIAKFETGLAEVLRKPRPPAW